MTRRKGKMTMKTKRSWRKIDVSGLETALELKRIEEKTGGIRSAKADSELFCIDRMPGLVPARSSRRRDLNEKMVTLNCHAPLRGNCSFPRPIASDTSKEGGNPEPASQAVEVRARRPDMSKVKFDKNLWSTECGRQSPVLSGSRKMLPQIPAVQHPRDGISYMPEYQSYTELITGELEKEMEFQRRAFKARCCARKAEQIFKLQQRSSVGELLQGLTPCPEGEDVSDEQQNTPFKPSLRKRKTQKQKKRKRLAKLQANVVSRDDSHQFARLGSILKEIELAETETVERSRRRLASKIEEVGKTKRVGRHRYTSPVGDFNVPSELTASLRQVKAAGDLLRDRFKSYEERNMILSRNESY